MNLTNWKMVCSYHSTCLELPVALVDFKMEGCSSRVHHVFKGGYVVLNDIDFDEAERNIYRNCVDKLRGQKKSETLKKVGDSTVYGMEES